LGGGGKAIVDLQRKNEVTLCYEGKKNLKKSVKKGVPSGLGQKKRHKPSYSNSILGKEPHSHSKKKTTQNHIDKIDVKKATQR